MSQAHEGLSEVARQREQVSSRVQLPVWYLVLYGVGVALILAGPVLTTQYGQGILGFGAQAFGALVMFSPAFLFQRLTGIRLHLRTAAIYPSVVRSSILLASVVTVGLMVTLSLTLTELALPALLVAVLTGVAMAWALRNVYEGIARDIAEGKVRK